MNWSPFAHSTATRNHVLKRHTHLQLITHTTAHQSMLHHTATHVVFHRDSQPSVVKSMCKVISHFLSSCSLSIGLLCTNWRPLDWRPLAHATAGRNHVLRSHTLQHTTTHCSKSQYTATCVARTGGLWYIPLRVAIKCHGATHTATHYTRCDTSRTLQHLTHTATQIQHDMISGVRDSQGLEVSVKTKVVSSP